MGTFTALDAAQLQSLADAFGLGALRSSRSIAAGTINSNFALTTSTGEYFLRVNEGKSEEDVAWEARVVHALAAAGVPTPPPLSARDGKLYAAVSAVATAAAPTSTAAAPSTSSTATPSTSSMATPSTSSTATVSTASPPTSSVAAAPKWASAFAWRAGVHLAPDEVTVARAETFGRALAELHVAALALPADWRRRSIYDHGHLIARFDTFRDSTDPVLAPAIALLVDELRAADQAVAARARATQGLIHGDLFRDNVLWDADERARIVAILDFEQASGGSLAYDLAVCINDWCWTERPRIELARALLAGYQSVRPLTPGDREALPIEIRAAAARFTITRITDVYLAKVENPEKDFRAFLARVEAWRGPSLRELTGSL